MIKYAQVYNEETGLCIIGEGTDSTYYESIGMQLRDVTYTTKGWILTEKYVEADYLQNLKTSKQEENTRLAKLAVENGHVVFKNAEFETNAQTVGDLTATMLLMQASGIETYSWLSKDDQAVDLTLEDFGKLGGLIAEYKNTIWQEKYIAYKTAIEQAETIEAVNAIDIDYTTDELTEQTEE